MKKFRKIFEAQAEATNKAIVKTIQESIEIEKEAPKTKMETLIEAEANPIQIIREFGYKIKLEKPTKKGKTLVFFKAKDAESAFMLVDGVYDKYTIEQDENEIRIELN